MCKAFSCLVTRGDKVYWKAGKDSHSDIIEFFKKIDANLADDKLPPLNTFARIEIVPPNGNYLNVDFFRWIYQIDEKIKPDFLTERHEDLCRSALLEWAKEVYTFNVAEAKSPIHPFNIVSPEIITEEHIALVKKWASIRASVGDSVWASVGDSVRASVGDSVWDSVWDSVGDSVRASVGDSVWISVWAYIGSLFPIEEWKHIDYKNPLFKKGEYPFQPTVDLWKMGLVPSFNGKVWRLHGGKDGKVLWEGTL